MAKSFCKDHADKKGAKPGCASCSNLRDGSHAAAMKAGIVVTGKRSDHGGSIALLGRRWYLAGCCPGCENK